MKYLYLMVLRRAKLLFTHQSDELMQKQLNALKEIFFDRACGKPHDNVNIEENCWLLVQYSKGLNKLIYSVISDKEALWKFKNRYPNVITYIAENDAIHQAIILRKSLDRNELCKELHLLNEYCSNTIFPITNPMITKFNLPPLCQNGLSPPHSPSLSPTSSDDI
ncbi:hypothetical protein DOY81_011579 [Sarcophaga bullata]|nr:hypothetical protein DOY81_011579 [Sarcophaga bullata]